MKKLSRLHVGQLDELPEKVSLADEKPEEPKYGSSEPCFYNCIAYVAEKFGWSCSPEKVAQDYVDGQMYKSIYGNGENDKDLKWKGTGCENDKDNGPDAAEKRNGEYYPNKTAYSYIDGYFRTIGRDWSKRSDVVGLVEAGGCGYVMGVMLPTKRDSKGCVSVGSSMHSVIVQSYSREKMVYTYYDPTTGSYGKCSLSDMRYGGLIMGLRDSK